MSETKMQTKDSNKLLNPASAVEDFLDTLLQESTQRTETIKPVRLENKNKLLLMPELVIPSARAQKLEVDTKITTAETVKAVSEVQQRDEPESAGLIARSDNYKFPLQCLMFIVAGNQLSIPLINLGSVLPWGGRLTLLPDAPDWFLGILKHRDQNVKVADTAKIMKINRHKEQGANDRHILVLGDDSWAITCDRLGEVVYLEKEDIQWSKHSGNSLTLGTIRQSLASLLDPYKILTQLNRHETQRNA